MPGAVRITKLGGRYLVFDVHDVAALRRDHCICAVFVGTTPQNPNQNVFAGLPIELLAEEAALLVDKRAAFVVDDAAAHLAQLRRLPAAAKPEPSGARHTYLQSLRTRRRQFQRAFEAEEGAKRKVREEKRLQSLPKAQSKRDAAATAGSHSNKDPRVAGRDTDSDSLANDEVDEDSAADVSLFGSEIPTAAKYGRGNALPTTHITPTTSLDMLADPAANTVPVEAPRSYPLYKYLNARGYYITPGIRFGADYSVYPGDPFRYHAHFMATSYAWDEEFDMLDLVTGGRLGTGVKKGFLIGGAPPQETQQADIGNTVRAFTIEWAAM